MRLRLLLPPPVYPYVLNAVCFLLALGGEYELLRGVGSADARRMTVCGAICALAMFIPWRFYFVAAAVALAGFGTAFAFMMKKREHSASRIRVR